MNIDELVKMVSCGMEYNFYLNDEEYWISNNEAGYYLTRVKDSYSQEFATAEELFEKGRINGASVFELWDQIKEYF
jgi:SAM-dependent MidA family methyltransferase